MTEHEESKERLKQELEFLAKVSIKRFIDYALKAAYVVQHGDQVAAMNCQTLSDLNSNDAIQAAFESGQVFPLPPEEPKITQDNLLDGAGLLIDQSQYCAFDAMDYFTQGKKEDGNKSLKTSRMLADQALKAAISAGRLQKDGKIDRITPTLTLLDQEQI